MNILVTGGAGYIGSHTVVELIQQGYQVTIVDNFSNSHPAVLDRIQAITGQSVPCYEADINDTDALDQIFAQKSFDAVIHFAAYKAVGESVEQPAKYYRNNIGGTISLIEAMQRHGVHRIVYSSSATVYGSQHSSPLDESMAVGTATNPYGYTKIVSEQLLKDVCYADQSWGVTLLRYFNPIGAHASGLIGEDPEGVPNNLMPFITRVAIQELPEVSVFGNDYDTKDGTGVRDYIHVVDLARGHVKALERLHSETGTSIYNLGTGMGYSVLELIETFQRVTGKKIPYRIAPRRAGDVAMVYADCQLAERELGWHAEFDLEQMCRDSWHFQAKNPQGIV